MAGLPRPASRAKPHGMVAAPQTPIPTIPTPIFDRTGTVEAQMPAMFLDFPLWMKTLWDVVSLIAQQPAVDGRRIGVLGFSLGAYLALSLACIDARVQAVAEYFGG